MDFSQITVDIQPVVDHVRNRTLSKLPCDFSRLVYLVSARDFNTGQYFHDGLACHFTEKIVSSAFAVCHREIFDRLVFCSLEELVEELSNHISSTCESPGDALKSWANLEAYRITVPLDCDELAAQLFFSNVKVALAILERQRKVTSQDERVA
jgi:hypothetical protein